MEPISTSTVTTVEDTSFVVLTGVFVSRNRSKGASIDDRSARVDRINEAEGKKDEGRNAHRAAIRRGMCGSACLFEEGLFVEQTENASEALAKREKPATSSRGRRRWKRNDTLPHPPRQRAGRPLFIFRPQHNILLRKAARARHDLRAAVPLPFAIAL